MKFASCILVFILMGAALAGQNGERYAKSTLKRIIDPARVQSQTKTTDADIATLLSLAASNTPDHSDSLKQFALALSYFDKAITLSRQNRLQQSFYKASLQKMYMLFAAGKVELMKEMFLSSNDSLKAEVARNISRYYNDDIFEPTNFVKAVQYGEISLEASAALKDRDRLINANNQLGFVYTTAFKFAEAEKYFLQVINLGKKLKSNNVGFAYMYLISINDRKGYLNKAVQFGLDALRYLERPGYDDYSTFIYIHVGRLYSVLGDYNKSISYINKACQEAIAKEDINNYWTFTPTLIDVMLNNGKANEALASVQKSLTLHAPPPNHSRVLADFVQGKVYCALGDFQKGKRYLLQAQALNQDPYTGLSLYKSLAYAYFVTGERDTSKMYVDKIFAGANICPVASIAECHLLAFKIDSAEGRFESAVAHLQKHKLLTDSLNALSRLRQMEELKLQYENDKIVQDVALKQQKIMLLEKEKELQSKEFESSRLKFVIENKDKENHLLSLGSEAIEKDKNIILNKSKIAQLQADNASRQAGLEKANFARDITFAFVLLLAIIVILLYRQFKAKQSATNIIGMKNDALEKLLQDKQRLLEEKDWLLKEVHHRVKNNLQTVVSLLESQSGYLDSTALEANRDSRNRVYAMSLVHQKLYLAENVASIQMDSYLAELIQYLRDSMDVRGITFKMQLVPAQLEVSQAISLGLILNEAITNSLKHAFPASNSKGQIEVTIDMDAHRQVLLTVKDNGVGLPDKIIRTKPSSLGLKLMRGLAEELNGSFEVQSDHGTVVKVAFTAEDALNNIHRRSNIASPII